MIWWIIISLNCNRNKEKWMIVYLVNRQKFYSRYCMLWNERSKFNALSFYVTKTVLVGPKWFWSDQIDLDLTIMIWSRPKWNGHDQNELVRSKLWFSTKMNHIWTWPIHFGRDHFILVVTKSLWSSPNQFGQTKTILDRPKLFWSHRRTRHKNLKIVYETEFVKMPQCVI